MNIVNERKRDSKERERAMVDTWALPVWLRLRDQRWQKAQV